MATPTKNGNKTNNVLFVYEQTFMRNYEWLAEDIAKHETGA